MKWILLCGVAGLSALVASSALAQSTEPETELEEIVVTAQKRSENLQSTPLAVSAITAATIERRGITDVSTLTAAAPNLSITTTGSSTANIALFIRGIGENDTILTVDSPVGLYVDGVILGRSSGAVFDLLDLERIEVLRGPQGTLYGRNTTGGAVNLISRKPAEALGGDLLLNYGNFNALTVKAGLDTGLLGDTGLSARFTYLHKEREGYIDNVLAADDQDPGAYKTDAVRAALHFDRGGALRADYAFDYNNRRSVANAMQLAGARSDILDYLQTSAALGGQPLQIGRDRMDTLRLDDDGPITDKVIGHALTAELDINPNLTLRSLTGYRSWSNTVVNDLDGNGGLVGFVVDPIILAGGPFTPLGAQKISLFNLTFDRGQHQFTQELNLLGKIGSKVDFVVGGFYFREVAREDNPTNLTFILPLGGSMVVAPGVSVSSFGVNLVTNTQYQFESESAAAFGQATFHLDDKLSLTGGLRYTRDEKKLDQTIPYLRSLERSFEEVNWAVSADYQWTENVMTYARVATGYKAGGFNARSQNDGFEPEDLISYEVGLKSELFDRRLRANVTLFHTEHDDVQVGQFLAGSAGSVGTTVNAGEAHYDGIELELAARLGKLTLGGNFGYVDRQYDSFIVRDPVTDDLVDVASTARFIYSPSTTANLNAEYEFGQVGPGSLSVRLDYSYRSRVYWHSNAFLNPFNDFISDGPVGLLDGRIRFADFLIRGEDAEISLWARNLTDEDYLLGGVDFGSLGFSTVSYAPPRTFGVDLKVTF